MHFDHRIASDFGATLLALSADGRERIVHLNASSPDRPIVGDRVSLDAAGRIVAIAPRHGVLARARHDRGATPQPIAANLDVVFVVTAPGRDFSPARVERYLVAVRASRARAVVVLNKSDLATDPAALVAELYGVSGDAPVVALSAEYGDGCDQLDRAPRRRNDAGAGGLVRSGKIDACEPVARRAAFRDRRGARVGRTRHSYVDST